MTRGKPASARDGFLGHDETVTAGTRFVGGPDAATGGTSRDDRRVDPERDADIVELRSMEATGVLFGHYDVVLDDVQPVVEFDPPSSLDPVRHRRAFRSHVPPSLASEFSKTTQTQMTGTSFSWATSTSVFVCSMTLERSYPIGWSGSVSPYWRSMTIIAGSSR
jgi:hypothetical protein